MSIQHQKRNLASVLRRYAGQRTVLGVAIPILEGYIRALKHNRPFPGATMSEIVAGFNDLAARYLRSDFHPTYVERRLGQHGFLELIEDRYRFRSYLLDEPTIGMFEALRDELVASLRSAFEERQRVMKTLENTCSLPLDRIEDRHHLVSTYLAQLTGNRGEMFEVVSFAILREYFRTFGFTLHRFSTTHANDGGMDFVASDAIYQVTVDESAQKVRKDLAKVPGTKRVLVRREATDEILRLCEQDVLEVVELKDLLQHFISWLLSRDTRQKQAKHLQEVLRIALDEFKRENKAASA